MPGTRKRTFTQSGLALGPRNPRKTYRTGASSYRPSVRGRRAGTFRKVGYWGRYPGAGGPAHGGELKFHDIDWDEAVANLSAGVISNTSSLVLIGQGITESLRIGRKCIIKSIGWRGKATLAINSGTSVANPQTVRFIIVHDSQCNGAAPLVATAAGVLETAHFQSFNNLANKGRFHTLYDKTITLNALAAAGNGTADDTGAVSRNFAFYKKCNIPVEYSGTASPADITEIRTNNIFGVMIADSTESNVSLDSKFRFRFSDG